MDAVFPPKKILCLLLINLWWGCTFQSNTEIYQQRRNNIVSVKNELQEIDLGDVLAGQFARLYCLNDYLIIADARSYDKQIHIFNANDFSHLASVADRGQGPEEIASLGFIGVNEKKNEFYVSDHGKQQIFCYNMDSILGNPRYKPSVKMKMNERQFPQNYQVINDSLWMGVIIEPTGNSGFVNMIATINASTGEIKPMRYHHPEIEKKRVSFAMSELQDFYVECYHYHDLMTILNMDGSIKKNIYGRKWNPTETNKYGFYVDVKIGNEMIVASFSDGKDRFSKTKYSDLPTQYLIFNRNGDYLKTLETDYPIMDFCYDKVNNRIIMHLNDEKQFTFFEF